MDVTTRLNKLWKIYINHAPRNAGTTVKYISDAVQDGIQHGRNIRVRTAQHKKDTLRHTDDYRCACQIRDSALERRSHTVDGHAVQFENDGDNTCRESHDKELGCDLRDIESALGNAQ